MLLTLDIGNTNVVAVVYDIDKKLVFSSRFVTVKQDALTFYSQWLKDNILPLRDEFKISAYCLSCVVPSITDQVVASLKQVLDVDGINVTTKTVPEFVIHLVKPEELGADFIATSYGAMAKYPLPIILADLGSATKISVLNAQGEFEGGIISPGVGISIDALNRFIPHLPEIKMEVPAHIIGKDTVSSMQSGWLYGTITSVEGMAEKIEQELGETATHVLTGGYSISLHHAFTDFSYDEYLLNEGLFEIYRKHVSKPDF
ncbi:MAG: type III pantothenate kinase [Erysipelotrichaceae bacterium]